MRQSGYPGATPQWLKAFGLASTIKSKTLLSWSLEFEEELAFMIVAAPRAAGRPGYRVIGALRQLRLVTQRLPRTARGLQAAAAVEEPGGDGSSAWRREPVCGGWSQCVEVGASAHRQLHHI